MRVASGVTTGRASVWTWGRWSRTSPASTARIVSGCGGLGSPSVSTRCCWRSTTRPAWPTTTRNRCRGDACSTSISATGAGPNGIDIVLWTHYTQYGIKLSNYQSTDLGRGFNFHVIPGYRDEFIMIFSTDFKSWFWGVWKAGTVSQLHITDVSVDVRYFTVIIV